MTNKTVILDRDGTINESVYNTIHRKYNSTGFGAPFKPEDFKLKAGVPAAINSLREKDYRIFVASNQGGVAKGYHTIDTLDAMNEVMQKELGIPKENVFYCTHDVSGGCGCRKPEPGLLLQAAEKHGFNVRDAVMIGDNWKDIAAGKAAGCRQTIYIGATKELEELTRKNAMPDIVRSSLEEAARLL